MKAVLKAKKLILARITWEKGSTSKRSYLLTLRKILPDKNSAAQLPLWPSNTPILCKEIRRPWISRLGRNSQNTIAAASGHHSESNGDLGSRWRADRRCPVGYASWAQKAATPAASWVRPKQLNGREMVWWETRELDLVNIRKVHFSAGIFCNLRYVGSTNLWTHRALPCHHWRRQTRRPCQLQPRTSKNYTSLPVRSSKIPYEARENSGPSLLGNPQAR